MSAPRPASTPNKFKPMSTQDQEISEHTQRLQTKTFVGAFDNKYIEHKS